MTRDAQFRFAIGISVVLFYQSTVASAGTLDETTTYDGSAIIERELGLPYTPPAIQDLAQGVSIWSNNGSTIYKILGGALVATGDQPHLGWRVDLSIGFDAAKLDDFPNVVRLRVDNGRPLSLTVYDSESTAVTRLLLQTDQEAVTSSVIVRADTLWRTITVTQASGISQINMISHGKFFALDDLQYGWVAPEPPSSAFLSFLVKLLFCRCRVRHPWPLTLLRIVGGRSKQNQPPTASPFAGGGWCA